MVPRLEFIQEQLDPARWGSSSDHGFQHLVRDLLRSAGRDVHGFEAAGKDGGIDIFERVADVAGGHALAVWECKFVSTAGTDALEAARARWLGTKENLERNLAAATGPPSGQRQYRPWYDPREPIHAYEIWFGTRLKNLEHFKRLEAEISDFFHDLAVRHKHLAHLANLDVTVKDWIDAESILQDNPHVEFRWFPQIRPRGLYPLGAVAPRTEFAAYLRSARLPTTLSKTISRHISPIRRSRPRETCSIALSGTKSLL